MSGFGGEMFEVGDRVRLIGRAGLYGYESAEVMKMSVVEGVEEKPHGTKAWIRILEGPCKGSRSLVDVKYLESIGASSPEPTRSSTSEALGD